MAGTTPAAPHKPVIPSDEKADQKLIQGAKGQLAKDYNVVDNNCVDVCSDALNKAGFNPGYETKVSSAGTGAPGYIDTKFLSPIPNQRYENIVKNNPGGTDITNKLRPKR